MLIPYSTDAPIYHLPIVTLNLIVANCAAFFGMLYLESTMAENQFVLLFNGLVLEYGNGLRPWQWVTSCFLHGDFLHLLGNMFCLWGFGLVVEGKVGWWRFLLIYFGVAIGQGFLEQSMMLFAGEGGSIGASAVVYALLAIAMLWAPENEMSCLFLFFFRIFAFDVKISSLAALAMFIEIGGSMWVGLAMSSQVLHLMGAVAGFAIGAVMLKRDWVDCEGWDFFSVWSGREKKTDEDAVDAARALMNEAENKRIAQTQAPIPSSVAPVAIVGGGRSARPPVDEGPLRLDVEDSPSAPSNQPTGPSVDDVRRALQQGNPTGAFAAYRELGKRQPPPERELLQIITMLHEKQQWSASIPPMLVYVTRFQAKASRIRLRLAHVLISVEKRPRQALRVLSKVRHVDLAPEEQITLANLEKKAEQQRNQIANEAPVQDW